MSQLAGEIALHAGGLGLLLSSPGALARLDQGACYMRPGEDLGEPLRGLVEREQRAVLLGTGSPQLDYRIRLWLGAPEPAAVVDALGRCRFALAIAGGALAVRDGYDPMDWRAEPEPGGGGLLPLADGYYSFRALWVPSGTPGTMAIELHATLAKGPLPGDGWPYLEYDLSRAR